MTVTDPVLNKVLYYQCLGFRGLKKKWLAEQLGVSCGHFTNMVSGRARFQAQYRERLALALSIPINTLFIAAGREVEIENYS